MGVRGVTELKPVLGLKYTKNGEVASYGKEEGNKRQKESVDSKSHGLVVYGIDLSHGAYVNCEIERRL